MESENLSMQQAAAAAASSDRALFLDR